MKIIRVEQKSPEWLEVRKGKVTGTGLKKILGTKSAQDQYFYEILAERLATSDGTENENAMDRGSRIEADAREAFEKRTGKIVEEAGFLQADFDRNAGCSPDGIIRKGKKYTEGVEIKCLSSANHVRAWLTNEVPEEHMPQVIQAFIVNKDMQTMHVVFFDPRIKVHRLHVIKVERVDIKGQIGQAQIDEQKFLARVDEAMAKIIKL